jgi:putative membrane protein
MWVYGEGSEPDYRFSFANERTFLAWIRTSLALIASGVAVDLVGVPDAGDSSRLLGVLLVMLGVGAAILAGVRWAQAERAMRLSRPLPGFSLFAVLPIGLVVAGVVLVVVLR